MAELFGRVHTREELLKRIGRIEQVGGVRLVEIADGVGRGIRVVQMCSAGGLSANILIERGMDIYEAHYNGIPLAWISPTGPTHPSFYEPHGVGWRRAFYGGLMLTCGMTTMGTPSFDGGEALGLHGRFSNTPATSVNYGGHWDKDEYVMFVQGEVREVAVSGENLLMRRRIELVLGESKISVSDSVTNEGYHQTPHMLLYHINAGYPVLDVGSRLVAPTQSVTLLDNNAAMGQANYAAFTSPIAHCREQVFMHRMVAGTDGYVTVALVNPNFNNGDGLGIYVRYRQRELPCFNEWKMMGEGTYAVALEPATNTVEGRAKARRESKLLFLEPGEERHYHLELGVLTCLSEIAELEKRMNVKTPD